MFLKEFNQTPASKLSKLNHMLNEQFGINVKATFPSRKKLEKILENTNMAILKLRDSNKKFQLEPEYAKFLGLKDAVEIMISEGMYAESPRYMEMKNMIADSVCQLMDSGYTMDEATSECMNRYRMDSRFAYDDDHVLPIIITAAKKYMDEYGKMQAEAAVQFPSTDLSDILLRELAKEVGVELADSASYSAIEETLNTFAEASGKSRDAVVGFLNGLDEVSLTPAIQMFGRKIGEANAFVKARRDAVQAGKKEFEVGGETYKVTGDTSDEKKQVAETNLDRVTRAATESMFDDILNDLLTEEVDVEQAEVVMAVRALADDVQDQIERIGRMMNEDVPAIADKMRGEMGAQAAQSFADSVNQLLSAHLEATKGVKSGLDQSVSAITGEEMVGGPGDTGDLGEPAPQPDMPEEEPEIDINEPAAAGPEESPLGRAEI